MLAGVDGCRNGWIVARAAGWSVSDQLQIEFCRSFAEVLDLTKQSQAVAVDMPIGLPDDGAPRACDLAARQMLGSQRSSVFLAPPRRCLDAKTPQEFQRIHREIRGVGAGLPVWGIVPKMLEVNIAFEREPGLQNRIFEFHPELTWRRLAGSRRPLRSKRTATGILERITILNKTAGSWAPRVPFELEGGPAIDDVLDAVAGIAAAQAFLHLQDREGPQTSTGLRMEIRH
jgi:predicted RNase H-like nuclease